MCEDCEETDINDINDISMIYQCYIISSIDLVHAAYHAAYRIFLDSTHPDLAGKDPDLRSRAGVSCSPQPQLGAGEVQEQYHQAMALRFFSTALEKSPF